MDWIRRNWPDMLIGIALVAVIAGIIATLLTGGSFFPLGQSGSSGDSRQTLPNEPLTISERRPDDSLTQRSGTTAEQRADDSSAQQSDSDSSEASVQSNSTGSTQTGTPVGESAAGSSEQSTVQVTALPLPGSGEQQSTTGSNRAEPAAERSDVNQIASAAGVAGAAPAPENSAATAGTEEDGSYRVSVGAFSNRENAERQAATFREAGYPVFIGSQGNLAIVLVGPYEQLSEAESAEQAIRSGDFGIEPVIYRFEADDVAAGSSSASQAANSGASSSSESAAPQAAAAAQEDAQTVQASSSPAPQPTAAQASGARYLQVGAYGTSASAQPQKERLEGLGFRVTERTEGDLVKLLVGPFAGEQLSEARSLLTGQGIDHFPR